MSAIVISLQRRDCSSWQAPSSSVLRSSSRAGPAEGVRCSAVGIFVSCASRAAAGRSVDGLEVDLIAHPAVRAGPVLWHLAPAGSGREALAWVTVLLVVDVAAGGAAVAAHGVSCACEAVGVYRLRLRRARPGVRVAQARS